MTAELDLAGRFTCPNGCVGFWLTQWERDEHVRETHPARSGGTLVCVSCDGPTKSGLYSHCRAILRSAPPVTDFASSTERSRLIQRIEELEEGLRPFAKAADMRLCGSFGDHEQFGRTDVGHHLTFGDLRRARTLTPNEGR